MTGLEKIINSGAMSPAKLPKPKSAAPPPPPPNIQRRPLELPRMERVKR